MKIWCQSCTAIGISEEESIWGHYYQAQQNHAKKVCRVGTVCEFHGMEKTIPGVDRFKSAWHLCQHGSIKNAIRAEKEGFDAFLMVSTPDVGFREIRELVDIPVIFITQATLMFCSLLAPNFAFIAHNRGLLNMLYDVTERYGLTERMVPGGNLDITYLDVEMAYQNPQPTIEAFTKVAKEIISRGATLLFPVASLFSQWLIEQNIRKVEGVTIIDPLGIALKITEMMVDLERLGIKRSKIGAYASPGKEVQQALHREFGV
jgi:allantoin racemase